MSPPIDRAIPDSVGTSAMGSLKQQARLVFSSATMPFVVTSSDDPSTVWSGFVHEAPPTGSVPKQSWMPTAAVANVRMSAQPTARAIARLRLLAGLTWDQLARLFGVSRRAVHFWASGMAMNVANETRLHRILDVVIAADRGDAHANRTALLEAANGSSAFELLVGQQWEEARQRLGPGSGRNATSRRELDEKSKAARRPSRPADHLDSREETEHRDLGRERGAKMSRNTRGESEIPVARGGRF